MVRPRVAGPHHVHPFTEDLHTKDSKFAKVAKRPRGWGLTTLGSSGIKGLSNSSQSGAAAAQKEAKARARRGTIADRAMAEDEEGREDNAASGAAADTASPFISPRGLFFFFYRTPPPLKKQNKTRFLLKGGGAACSLHALLTSGKIPLFCPGLNVLPGSRWAKFHRSSSAKVVWRLLQNRAVLCPCSGVAPATRLFVEEKSSI